MKDNKYSQQVNIRVMKQEDIALICKADKDESEENQKYLYNQLQNQDKGECKALLALYNGEVAGYVFLYYQCKWGRMGNQGIPGVVDLIVFDSYRRKGIATELMNQAEKIAKQFNSKIYLDVCLNKEYGPAQRLYIKRGYIPDGKGIYYKEKECEINAICKNDDELTLCLVKKLE